MTSDQPLGCIAVGEVKVGYRRLLNPNQWNACAKLITEALFFEPSMSGGPPPTAGYDAATASLRNLVRIIFSWTSYSTKRMFAIGTRLNADGW